MECKSLFCQTLRIVLPYTIFGCLWIWGSDRALLWFTRDPETISTLSMYKGWAFMAVTSSILFVQVWRRLRIQRRLYEQLETRRIDLEEFLYAASHHLRTPLFTIHGFAGELVHDSDSREQVQENTRRIMIASAQMEEILLSVTRLHRSLRKDPKPTSIQARTILEHTIHRATQQTPQFQGRFDIQSTTNCLCDIDQLETLIYEIIINFIRHCPSKPESLLTIRDGEFTRSTCSIVFEDNGPGFMVPPPESLFHPALRKQNIDDAAGLRIGLAIAWRCAKWNDGSLLVESQKGKGTRITLTLPKRH